MKKNIYFTLFACFVISSCTTKQKKEQYHNRTEAIVGTWKLISGITIENGDSIVTDYTKGQEAIKIIGTTHFSFFRHDLNAGKDSLAIFVSGGGIYSLAGDVYTEHLKYCNFRSCEGLTFDFRVNVQNDTLIQSGYEKVANLNVDRKIIETYVKYTK